MLDLGPSACSHRPSCEEMRVYLELDTRVEVLNQRLGVLESLMAGTGHSIPLAGCGAWSRFVPNLPKRSSLSSATGLTLRRR